MRDEIPAGSKIISMLKNISKTKVIKIASAGGFLVDLKKKKLLILKARHHQGKMELPKGKIEKGETPAQAAFHEVGEESGYGDIKNLAYVGQSYYSYVNKVKNYSLPYGAKIKKIVHYFLFALNSPKKDLRHRESHEEFENYWVDFADIYKTLSFPGDRRLWLKAEQILKKYIK